MNQKLEDSGERREFSTGAVRDRGGLKPRPDLISPHANLREGMIHTLGSEKYDLRNWEQGMPISECLASAQRHIEQYKRGDTNEDHIAQARWNIGAIIHFEEEIKAGRMDPSLDDMPKYTHRPDWETDDGRGVVLFDTELNALVQKAWEPPLDHPDSTIVAEDLKCRTWDVPSESSIARPPRALKPHPLPLGSTLDYTKSDCPPTFYVAGPMRGCEELNFKAFDEAAERGRKKGYTIISPADLDREHGIDPTVAEQENTLSVSDLHRIIRRDVEAIMSLQSERGDGIAVLPGWRESIGARAEVALAQWLGLRVVMAGNFHTPALETEIEYGF